MRIPNRRAAVAAAVLPLLALAACTDGGSDARNSASGASGSSAPAGRTPAGSQKPLTAAKLKSALITTADVPGYVVTKSGQADAMTTADALTTDKGACQPLADPVSAKPKYPRTAQAAATFSRQNALTGGGEVTFLLLAAHAPGDAGRIMADLAQAVKTCGAFKGTDGNGKSASFTVRAAKAVDAGDDSVAYVLTDTGDKKSGSATVTVVRSGGYTETYLTVRTGGGAGTLPVAVARKQDEKVKAAAS